MKLKILVATCAVLASGVAIADSYQAEVGAAIARIDNDGLSSNENFYGLNGAYYFAAVKTANVPLAEAAYLGKNTNAHAQYGRTTGRGNHNNFYELGAEIYIPESFLYFDAAVLSDKSDERTDNDWYGRVGVTPIDGLLVSTGYYHDDGYDFNIKGKYVMALGSDEFINVEAEIIDNATDYKMLGGDYYLDSTFSVGGMIENSERGTPGRGTVGNEDSGNHFTVRTRKFFNDQISGELAYTDKPGGNVVMAGASIRF